MALSWKVLFFLIILVAIISNQIVFVNAQTLPSPLKQFESGIWSQDIKCYKGFELIIKATNAHPACVKPTTATRLLSHGWITLEVFESTHTITNPICNSGCEVQDSKNETSIISNQTNTNNTTGSIQLPLGISTPTISSTKSGIKIISIEMYPDPLKVGDKPQFKITYQNISDKIINYVTGCTASSLGYTLSPPDHVQEGLGPAVKCPNGYGPIQPNQIVSNNGRSHYLNGYYEIMKSGTLHVTLELFLNDEHDNTYLAETVQFDVNATQ